MKKTAEALVTDEKDSSLLAGDDTTAAAWDERESGGSRVVG